MSISRLQRGSVPEALSLSLALSLTLSALQNNVFFKYIEDFWKLQKVRFLKLFTSCSGKHEREKTISTQRKPKTLCCNYILRKLMTSQKPRLGWRSDCCCCSLSFSHSPPLSHPLWSVNRRFAASALPTLISTGLPAFSRTRSGERAWQPMYCQQRGGATCLRIYPHPPHI